MRLLNMRSMQKIGWGCVGVAMALAAAPAFADNVHFATPQMLEITIKKFELCADAACATAAVLGSGDVAFDIASKSSGADIGSYAANASIPRGVTYNYARITMNRTFRVSGAANVSELGAAAACYTKNGNPNTGLAEIESADSDPAVNLATAQAAATPQAIFLAEGPPPEGDAMVSEVYTADTVIGVLRLTSPIRLNPDSQAPEIAISIDAHNAMSFSNNGSSCYADEEPPTISVTAG